MDGDRSAPLHVTLLGRPGATCGGAASPAVRGRKAWALLAYLASAGRPVGRGQLVSMLFAEADDPLGALRWNLSALRRSLGPVVAARSAWVELTLPAGSTIDLLTVVDGPWEAAAAVPTLDRELLEGMAFDGCPALELWLAGERRRAAAAAESALHQAALARLAAGDTVAAVGLARRVVALAPLDENAQVLLVRALAAGGDGVAAAQQVAACRRLFRRELGVEPGPALDSAAAATPGAASTSARLGRPAITALLEAGRAAVAAGVLDAGLETVRRAVDEARAGGPDVADLHVAALVELGHDLVHAARGRDEEGAAALHEALALGRSARAPATTGAALVTARRELGYVEFLQGRYVHAQQWLRDALGRAQALGDPAEVARVEGALGAVLSDLGAYGAAIDLLDAAVDGSSRADDRRGAAYAGTMLGRAHLLRGDVVPARAALEEALAAAGRAGWLAFVPWPESWLAGADLAAGDVDAAAARYEHAFAVGCQIGDPCWEGISGRGLGLVAVARGRVDEGLATLADAAARCVRAPDGYLWVRGYVLDALCAAGLAHPAPGRADDVRRWADDLAELAARAGMRDLLARAHGHRAALGDPAAAVAGRTVAAAVDSPALHALVGDGPTGSPA